MAWVSLNDEQTHRLLSRTCVMEFALRSFAEECKALGVLVGDPADLEEATAYLLDFVTELQIGLWNGIKQAAQTEARRTKGQPPRPDPNQKKNGG